jgi:phosphonatase-like hydrolase
VTYRLAVFDMAGTTVSNSGLVVEALIGSLKAHGFSASAADARPLRGYPKQQAIRHLLGADSPAANDAALVQRLYDDFVAVMLERCRNSTDVTPMPAAEACFAGLRSRGLRIALDTAFSGEIARTIVERFGWLRNGCIDDVIATDEVAAGRPAPDMIRALMARCCVADPSAVIKIGDTAVDIEEGRNARAGLVVAVTTGAFERNALRACAPDHIIDSLAELAPLLDLSRR